MEFVLTLILLLVFVACVIMNTTSSSSGLWSNLLLLFNVLLAGLLATNYYEKLAAYLDKEMPSFTYLWDFVALWLIFAVSAGVLRAFTDLVSRVKVKFRKPVEMIGSIFLACWIGWIMVCFTAFSLHTAPLARNFLGGGFQPTPQSSMFLGLAPDRRWMSFAHKMSRPDSGSLAAGGKPESMYSADRLHDLEEWGKQLAAKTNQPFDRDQLTAFDPQGDFILRYGARRHAFESEPELRVNKK